MVLKLEQKSYFEKRYFEILDDRIIIKRSTYKEDLEYYIRLEELGFDVFRKTEKINNLILLVLFIFDCAYVGLLINSLITWDRLVVFWLLVTVFFIAVTVACYINRNKSLVYLMSGDKTLELFSDKPDSNIVNEFIGSIHEEMRINYKNKYAIVDLSLPKEYSISRFKWLKEIKAISEEEYRDLMQDLETKSLF